MKYSYPYSLIIIVLLLVNIALSAQLPTELFPNEDATNLFSINISHPKGAAKTFDEGNLLIAYKRDLKNGENWTGRDSIEYYYNGANQLVLQINYDLINDVFVKDLKRIYEYDSRGNLTLIEIRKWDDTLCCSRYSWSYDFDNNLISEKYDIYNMYNDEWNNALKENYEYDAYGNVILCLKQQWDWTETWKYSSQTIYEYDANNNLISVLIQRRNGDFWEKRWRTVYEYDSNNNQVSKNSQMRSEYYWHNREKLVYEYDQNRNLISEYKQKWKNSQWQNDYKLHFFYYPNNELAKYSIYFWEVNSWILASKREYKYNKNRKIAIHGRRSDTIWVENSREVYYYAKEFPVSNSSLDIEVFPNPSKGEFYIYFEEEEIINGLVEIFNSNGQLVHFQKIDLGVYQLTINLEGLSNGTYYLELSDEDTKIKRTLMLVR